MDIDWDAIPWAWRAVFYRLSNPPYSESVLFGLTELDELTRVKINNRIFVIDYVMKQKWGKSLCLEISKKNNQLQIEADGELWLSVIDLLELIEPQASKGLEYLMVEDYLVEPKVEVLRDKNGNRVDLSNPGVRLLSGKQMQKENRILRGREFRFKHLLPYYPNTYKFLCDCITAIDSLNHTDSERKQIKEVWDRFLSARARLALILLQKSKEAIYHRSVSTKKEKTYMSSRGPGKQKRRINP